MWLFLVVVVVEVVSLLVNCPVISPDCARGPLLIRTHISTLATAAAAAASSEHTSD